jgi:hypothetical protein
VRAFSRLVHDTVDDPQFQQVAGGQLQRFSGELGLGGIAPDDGGAAFGPLFLGANPERIPSGPDEGLRALVAEVDLGWALYRSLDEGQRAAARGAEGWFPGFLPSPGTRRADLGKPAGLRTDALRPDQADTLKRLVAAYADTIAPAYAAPYLRVAFEEAWADLRFFWSGAERPGGSYYYRIAGRRLLIEHDNRAGGTHVHAIWRDAAHDFGGAPDGA